MMSVFLRKNKPNNERDAHTEESESDICTSHYNNIDMNSVRTAITFGRQFECGQNYQPILAPIPNLELRPPSAAEGLFEKGFEQLDVSKQFIDNFQMHGKSMACEVVSGVGKCGLGVVTSTTGRSSTSKLSTQSTSTASQCMQYSSVYYYYRPCKMVEVGLQHMHLSEEAILYIENVETVNDADAFLDMFGTHIPNCNTFGAWRSIHTEAIASSACSLQLLKDECYSIFLCESNFTAALPSATELSVGAKVCRNDSAGRNSQFESGNVSVFSSAQHISFPPGNPAYSTFSTETTTPPANIGIIDRGSNVRGMMSVWGLMERSSDESIRRKADLVRWAWINSARHTLARDESGLDLIRREILSCSQRMRYHPGQCIARPLLYAGLSEKSTSYVVNMLCSIIPSGKFNDSEVEAVRGLQRLLLEKGKYGRPNGPALQQKPLWTCCGAEADDLGCAYNHSIA
eukprot:CAMPEP_0185030812 /NCGR_PEP_ID=MMETSP1103-20130426/17884_1 /TAXON_ID=36769 /ORGANISM="Paraphysomonas bandaiensis, Strain Caron Lab Isolate" /LENGTH=458 /DNA_ID=CAMNT_0027566077 /DNA_START=20 /DNA_END=1396 /DNA_ORIENTATION=-